MATQTTKLKLVKSDYTEPADIAIMNANLDKIDQFAVDALDVPAAWCLRDESQIGTGDTYTSPPFNQFETSNGMTANSSGILTPVAGWYFVSAQIGWGNVAGGVRRMNIVTPGFTAPTSDIWPGGGGYQQLSGLVKLAANVRIGLRRYQTAGQNLSVSNESLAAVLVATV